LNRNNRRGKNMNKLLIILLLTTSCANYHGVRDYSKTTHYHVLGVKCNTGYYYSYDTDHCVKDHYVNSEDNPSGVSIDLNHSFKNKSDLKIAIKPSPDFKKPTNKRIKPKGLYNPTRSHNKINCRFILDNINKCSL